MASRWRWNTGHFQYNVASDQSLNQVWVVKIFFFNKMLARTSN